jgi:HPt (histidine-containing phosphotransfer) domain-containing protein
VAKVTINIDREQLLANFGDDQELLFESIELFLERVGGRYKDLDDAVKNRDAQKVREAGHTIKGMLGNFCTGEPFEFAKNLELMGKEGKLDNVDQALQSFKTSLDELCKYLADWLKEE